MAAQVAEAWLTGTPAELDAMVAALQAGTRVLYVGKRQPLSGADAGRERQYLRAVPNKDSR